jgi:serine/threonine-protein kinase MRCK
MSVLICEIQLYLLSANCTVSLLALVHPDNQLLGFLAYSAVDSMRAIELSRGEFLLVFQTLGVYVDGQGRKSRDREIMYPAIPQAVSKLYI